MRKSIHKTGGPVRNSRHTEPRYCAVALRWRLAGKTILTKVLLCRGFSAILFWLVILRLGILWELLSPSYIINWEGHRRVSDVITVDRWDMNNARISNVFFFPVIWAFHANQAKDDSGCLYCRLSQLFVVLYRSWLCDSTHTTLATLHMTVSTTFLVLFQSQ